MTILDHVGIIGVLAATILVLVPVVVISTMQILDGLEWLGGWKQRRSAAHDFAKRSEAEARRLAQEIANRERYPVHIGCGGEVTDDCHGCDLGVLPDDVTVPEAGQ